MVFDLNEAVRLAKEMAPVHFQEFCERFTPQQRGEIARRLEMEVEWLTRAAAYIDARSGIDRGHLVAVDRQNKAAARVRRVFGYTQTVELTLWSLGEEKKPETDS